MKLEAVNALAQLIAAIAAIVSLFYLGAQVRQNTRSTRAAVVDSLAHALVELLGQHTQRPEYQLVEDLPPISQLIPGESSSGASGPI